MVSVPPRRRWRAAQAVDHAMAAVASAAAPDALLLLPPFYQQPFSPGYGATGVEAFFGTFFERFEAALTAAAVTAAPPVYLYSFAMHTQQPIPADVYGRLCTKHPRLAGIKASAVTVAEAEAYKAAAPASCVMVGNGNAQLATLRAGLHVVSGDCVTIPWALTKLLELFRASDANADVLQNAIVSIWRKGVMEKWDEIPADKAAFAQTAGVTIDACVRAPLVAVDADAAATIKAAIAQLRAAVDVL